MRDKLPDPPPEWAAQHKKSAQALIAAELLLLRGLRKAVKAAVGNLLMNLADSGAPEADKLRALWSVRNAQKDIAASVEAEVLAGRGRAREAAIKRLSGELDLLRSQLRELDVSEMPSDPARSDGAEDPAFAKAAGDSYSAAWGTFATAAVLAWADDPQGSVATGLRKTVSATDYRLQRTATTENARAYSDEHDEGLAAVAEESAGEVWVRSLYRYWSALLDRRVCKVCEAHDGELVPAGRSFAGGDEPGEVHVCCRCIDGMVFLPDRIANDAAA